MLTKYTTVGLGMCMFTIGAFFLALPPILPDIGKEFSVEVDLLGYPAGAYSLALAISSLLLSFVADLTGRKWQMVLGIATHVLGVGVIATSGEFLNVVIGFGICGCAAGVIQPAAYSFISENTSPKNRSHFLGQINIGWAASTLVGVPIASFINSSIGWRNTALTTIVLWITAISLVFGGLTKGRSIKPDAIVANGEPNNNVRGLILGKTYWLLVTTMLIFFGFYGVYTFLGIRIRNSFSTTSGWAGFFVFWYGLGFLLGSFNTKQIDRIGTTKSLKIATAGLALTIGLISFATSSFIALILFMFVWGFCQVISFTALTSIAGSTDKSIRGRVLSLNTMAVMLGASMGAISMGFVNAHCGFAVVSFLCSVTTGLAMLIICKKL